MIPEDEIMYIRGIPVSRLEVASISMRYDAHLFDEVMFMHDEAKRIACANVIVELDKRLAIETKKQGKRPTELDIGDKSWLYIPIPLSGPDTLIQTNKVAWFRIKKYHKV